MRLPQSMLAAGILFWGWQTGAWGVAAAVAVTLGGAPWIRLRWDLSGTQINRLSDFCSALIAVLGVYCLVSFGSSRGIAMLFQWLPVAMVPVAVAHAYGTSVRLDASVFFWSLRRRPPSRPVRFDPVYPYLALWIFGASAANPRDDAFFVGLVLLAALPLVALRPLSYRVGTWAGAFCFATALGYGTQYGLHELQTWLETAVPDWMVGGGSRTNPYRSMTDIGHLGELKQSDAIVLRVNAGGAITAPLLLHRASYNHYAGASWLASYAPFAAVAAAGTDGMWTLAPAGATVTRIAVHDHTVQNNPVLSLPSGTVAIERLKARHVQSNPLGAVQVDRDTGHFSYVAVLDGTRVHASPPSEVDLRIGRPEHAAFSALAVELDLIGRPPAEVVHRVREHFGKNYRYSIFQERPSRAGSAIVDFVQRSRTGHCEYFATATVLLLRAGGVPARYATGFSVQEYSAVGQGYVVRQRHAHAWAHAWVNGAWTAVDTTPPDWFAIEAGRAPFWIGLRDAWSWLRYRLAHAQGDSPDYALAAAILVILPFALWLAIRLYRSRRPPGPAMRDDGTVTGPQARAGADSEYYVIERRLGTAGCGRGPHETPGAWLARLTHDGVRGAESLAAIVALHYRYRYDPRGLRPDERAALRRAAADWLAAYGDSSRTAR